MKFEHVKGHHITELAEKAHCSQEYIRKILSGEREASSVKAKAIRRAAGHLNAAIDKGMEKVDKDLQIFSEGEE